VKNGFNLRLFLWFLGLIKSRNRLD